MFFLLEERDLELIRPIDGGMVEGYIVLENFRNGWLFENRLPRALGLAGTAIDALVWVDVELVGKVFPVVAYIFVDTVNRTNTDASCIETVYAKTGYGPGHVLLFYLPNGPQPTIVLRKPVGRSQRIFSRETMVSNRALKAQMSFNVTVGQVDALTTSVRPSIKAHR
jgi:hypothetical protein